MTYQHSWVDGSAVDLPVGKVVCVGRNYAAHARELGNEVPAEPVFFIKPPSSLVPMAPGFLIPQGLGEVHHEIEVAVLVGETLTRTKPEEVRFAIAAYGLALDLTLREVQNRLKQEGLPWERAKAFDGACPVSGFIDARGVSTRQHLDVSLQVNGQTRQKGHTGQMLFPVFDLIAAMSECFTLQPGDLVLTGTPAGVGPLQQGDQLLAKLGNLLKIESRVETRDG